MKSTSKSKWKSKAKAKMKGIPFIDIADFPETSFFFD